MLKRHVWTGEFSVGVKLIDEQHQQFFKIANEIIDILEAPSYSPADVRALIGRLGDYALYHLSTEEDYFKKFEYEDAPKHIESHNGFRDKVSEFLFRINDEKVDIQKLAEDSAVFSSAWLSTHIPEYDKQYTQCFHEHGLY